MQATEPVELHSAQAEEALLGSVFIAGGVLGDVRRIVAPEDFYVERHGWVYRVLLALAERGEAIDLVTVTDELERRGQLAEAGGPGYVAGLVTTVPTAVNAESYARIVAEYAERRRYVRAAGAIVRSAYAVGDDIDDVRGRVSGAIRESVPAGAATVSAADIAREAMERAGRVRDLALAHPGEQVIAGSRSHLRVVDELTGGWADGSMNIVAARPGLGKSSLARQVALGKAQHGERVLLFSPEMPRLQVIDAMACTLAGIDSTKVRHGHLDDGEWAALVGAYAAIAEMPLSVNDDPGLTSVQIFTEARLYKERYGELALVIVDYIGLVAQAERGENLNAKMSTASRNMKRIAMAIAPTLVLAQLNRASAKELRRPGLTDLRDSGSLEQDADTVMFLHREGAFDPEYAYPAEVEAILAKNRHGSIGTGVMAWEGALTRFRDAQVTEINALWLSILDEQDKEAGARKSSEYEAAKRPQPLAAKAPPGVRVRPRGASAAAVPEAELLFGPGED